MNVFFGKISDRFDINQIEDGYYTANKGSSWFGSINIGDYTYIIGGNKIQLWKAREWGNKNGKECLWFDIIIDNLNIEIKQFPALKLFKLTKPFIVITTRSAKNRAFFELKLAKDINYDYISDPEIYLQEDLYRKIIIQDSIEKIDINSEDIQLYYKDNSLKLYKSNFFEDIVFNSFIDNTKYLGNGSPNKDKVIRIIKDKKDSLPNRFNFKDFSIINFYDAFFCKYEEKENSKVLENEIEDFENKVTKQKISLNQILYGPPGTGKTYHTINKAIQIINPDFDLNPKNRTNIKKEYDKLVDEGRIVFTTFHQSMSYEDFIEGIKPQKPEDNDSFLKYDIETGIFREICDRARKITAESIDVNWDEYEYYKMSVGGKNRPDLHDWCLENNVIGLGWGGSSDLSQYKNITNWQEYRNSFAKEFPNLVNESKFNIQATYMFLNMKVNDIVVISKGNHIIDAIGIVTGDYYWSDKNPVEFFHYRPVKWIARNMNTSPDRFLKKKISQMSIYNFSEHDIKKDAFKEITSQTENNSEKPYVLIIDEINRGNVSQIFGELITLIEEDKRLGKDESLEITLPYSKEKFGVPQNLYILGTMNTADRSVEALDTALRRRFSFEEMPPNSKLLEDKKISDFKLSDILVTINKRIEKLLNKDHLIGHSFFLKVDSVESLQETFYRNIIPLLQEYFFGDYGKIGLILGSGFIKKVIDAEDIFSDFEYDDKESLNQKEIYEIIDYRTKTNDESNFEKAIQILMNKKA